MQRFVAHPSGADAYGLGEGPVWDPVRDRLLWVDIVGGTVHAGTLDQGFDLITVTDTWKFEQTVGAAAISVDGELLVAEQKTLTLVDNIGRRTTLARVLPPDAPSRLNDGAVDPAGRFLIGSMANDETGNDDLLVRLDGTELTVLDDDLTLSNGLAWSPDGSRLYSIDSVPGIVWGRDYPTGGPKEELFRITDGVPDGMCADADGNLWIAIWSGGRVECHRPDGELLAIVDVPAPNTTSVTFAGPELDVLVITTATEDVSLDDLAKYPASGRLFTARVGVNGLPPSYWIP